MAAAQGGTSHFHLLVVDVPTYGIGMLYLHTTTTTGIG